MGGLRDLKIEGLRDWKIEGFREWKRRGIRVAAVLIFQSLDPSTLLEYRKIQGNDVDILEAIFHVTEHFSMHTGQIIMLTKMMTSDDLRFYEFDEGGVPVVRWRSGP